MFSGWVDNDFIFILGWLVPLSFLLKFLSLICLISLSWILYISHTDSGHLDIQPHFWHQHSSFHHSDQGTDELLFIDLLTVICLVAGEVTLHISTRVLRWSTVSLLTLWKRNTFLQRSSEANIALLYLIYLQSFCSFQLNFYPTAAETFARYYSLTSAFYSTT